MMLTAACHFRDALLSITDRLLHHLHREVSLFFRRNLRQVKGTLPFLGRNTQLCPEYLHRAVIRQLEIIDACHDAGQIVVRCQWWLARLAHYSEHRSQGFESLSH